MASLATYPSHAQAPDTAANAHTAAGTGQQPQLPQHRPPQAVRGAVLAQQRGQAPAGAWGGQHDMVAVGPGLLPAGLRLLHAARGWLLQLPPQLGAPGV